MNPENTSGLRLTAASQRYFTTLQQAHTEVETGIRLAIKEGGCSGMEYDWGVIPVSEGDSGPYLLCVESAVRLYVHEDSVAYVKNCVIDCEFGPLQQSQVVVRNPNAVHECGCGISFGVEKPVDGEE